ncbi:hypothetical protein RF11_09151 [Thelohanellus kitauei]|uniref:Uncharacterized protein n=1 Tax=Thelohanellus kitauei TaxID=669202 RepID=A0A0C2NB55_THEKT|nr:hypothetical protein RF11_09151 [Thelohanellus kitauei]
MDQWMKELVSAWNRRMRGNWNVTVIVYFVSLAFFVLMTYRKASKPSLDSNGLKNMKKDPMHLHFNVCPHVRVSVYRGFILNRTHLIVNRTREIDIFFINDTQNYLRDFQHKQRMPFSFRLI